MKLIRHMRRCWGLRSAFTLIELLVVISIIALLLSILMPSLTKARMQAQKIKCVSNVKQIGLSFNLYAYENKGILPAAYPSSWSDMWITTLYAFVYPQGNFFGTSQANILKCPAVSEQKYYYKDLKYAYGINGWYGYDPATQNTRNQWNAYTSNIDLNKIRRSSRVILAGDSVTSSVIVVGADVYLVSDRHPGGILNMIYADWHVEGLTKNELIRKVNDLEVPWGPWTALDSD